MHPKGVQFTLSAFNNIFPFFLLMDQQLNIVAMGSSIEKLFPNIIDSKFLQHFTIERPQLFPLSFEQLINEGKGVIMIKKDNLLLRGQFQPLENEKQVLFLGAPWFYKSNELVESGLTIKDFSHHNPTIEFLQMLQTEEITNKELKDILAQLNKRKNELEIAYEKIKKITTSLEESNLRYDYVNQATSEAIWDWNILTGEVYYGDGFKKMFGYDTKKTPQKFNIWEERIHPDDLERISAKIQSILESTEETWADEYRYLCANGNYTFVSDKGIVIRNEKGQPLRMMGAMQDISLHKQEEMRLRLLESVITNTQDAVIITEATQGFPIVYVNEAFTKITGYTPDDVKGKNPKIFQGPKSNKDEIGKLSAALKENKSAQITTINYKKSGEEYWVNFSVNPVFNDKKEITHWISIQKDTTEIIKANEEIRLQKKFTEDVLNNIPTDIAVFDPDHNYIFVNPSGIKNKEIREWIINKNDFDYVKMRNTDDTMARKRWNLFEEAIETKKKVEWIDEHSSIDGKKMFVMRNFYPYFEKNKLKFVIGYGIDITERKLIEIKLNEALDSIKKTNSELEQFAYVASHDLQEPLRMVTSFLTQLEKKYGQQLDDKAKEYIYYAVDGAKRMRQIILDLLEFSRAGKWDDEPEALNITEVVDDIKVLLSQHIKELNASIHVGSLPMIRAHKTPMRQVFQNLIGNSLKYHKSDVPPVVEISAERQGQFWLFTVKDNGIGIEPQYFEKIFVIFQRLHNKEEYSGTGIGLAITKKIIDRMGGRIWADSIPDMGTSIHFTLPANSTNSLEHNT